MPIRNLLISNLWQLVNYDSNNQPTLIKNVYLPPPPVGGSALGAVKAGSNITIASDGTISATGGGGSGIRIPYVQFTASATPSAGQTFTDVTLGLYNNVSSDATVVVNGSVLTPLVSYTISGNVLTVLDYLQASDLVQVQAKTAVTTLNYVSSVTVGSPLFNALSFTNPTTTPVLGIVNASSPTTQFLRGDGTWAVPPGGGGGGITADANWASTGTKNKPNNTTSDINLVLSTSVTGTLTITGITLAGMACTGTFTVSGTFPSYTSVITVVQQPGATQLTGGEVVISGMVGSTAYQVSAGTLGVTPLVNFTASVTGQFQNASYPFYTTTAPVITTGTSAPNAPNSFTLTVGGVSITTFASFTTTAIAITPTPTITGTVTGFNSYDGSQTVNINTPVTAPTTFIPAFSGQTGNNTPPTFTTASTQTTGAAIGSTITYPVATATTQYNWICTQRPLANLMLVNAFGSSPLVPDVTAPTQTIAGQVFNVYGWTNLGVGTSSQLTIS